MPSINLEIKNNIAWFRWDDPESKVNVLSEASLSEFSNLLDELSAKKVKAAVIISKKEACFMAGADLREIQKLKTKEEFAEKINKAHSLFKKMKGLKIPFIAAVHGACLGGGAELILACDFRIASLHPKTLIGFPEVQLGLIPGFGGCVKLHRLIGLPQALDLILSSKLIPAKKAHKMGLIDQAAATAAQLEDKALEAAQKLAQKTAKDKKSERKKKPSLLEHFPLSHLLFWWSKRQVLKKTKGFYPAPLAALNLIRKTHNQSQDKALAQECEAFCTLAVSDVSKNLIHLFFLNEKNKKKMSAYKKAGRKSGPLQVGVIGAGIMGSGIAYALAARDIEVLLMDVNKESLIKGRRHIQSLFQKQIKRRKINPFDEKMKQAKITYSLDLKNFSSADFVIEAASEDLSLKNKIFSELSSKLKDSAVIATNTSSLSVAEMSRCVKDPSRFIGLHFFNPVHRLPLVEVIPYEKTHDETLNQTIELASALGKSPVIVKDRPGFLVNRLLMPWLVEALWLLGEGENIRLLDKIFSKKFGWPMGPFRLMDEVGLDVCVKVIQNLKKGGLKLFYPPFTNELLDKSRLGKKTSLGFYHYTEGGQARAVNSEIEGLFQNSLKTSGKKLTPDLILKRGMLPMINEAAFILEEKTAEGPEDIDLAMIMGAGFPPFKGGLLKYADSLGIENLAKDLQELSQGENADRFKPCPLLLKKAQQKSSFHPN